MINRLKNLGYALLPPALLVVIFLLAGSAPPGSY